MRKLLEHLTTKAVTLYPTAHNARPDGIVFGSDGNMYVAAFLAGAVLRVTPAGAISTVAGLPAGHNVRGLVTKGGTLIFGDYDYCRFNDFSHVQARVGQITATGAATELALPTSAGTAAYITVRQSDGTVFFTIPGTNKYGMVLPAAATAPDAVVVEFFNNILGHYFITAAAVEASGIDSGAAGPGWSRTGQTFKAWKSGPMLNASPVCRFYGNQAVGGPNSHFFTVVAQECAIVQTDPGWTLETTSAYWIVQPGVQCPAFTLPVYRAYYNGFAQHNSNHRFTTDLATFNAMSTQGWAREGVVMCAPH